MKKNLLPICASSAEEWRVSYVPTTLAKAFTASGITADGEEVILFKTDRNLKRNVLIETSGEYKSISLVISENFGSTDFTHVFTFEGF